MRTHLRLFQLLQSAISSYNTSLLSWATDMLCQRLSLSPLPIPPEMCAPFMSVMILPNCLGPPTPENEEELRHRLFQKYNVQTNICVVDKQLCLRSANASNGSYILYSAYISRSNSQCTSTSPCTGYVPRSTIPALTMRDWLKLLSKKSN